MSIRKHLALAAAAAALVSGGVLTAPSAGAAAPEAPQSAAAPGNCRPGNYCVYWDAGYRGRVFHFAGDNPSWARWAIFNDDSSSWNNGTTGRPVALFGEENYVRQLGCLPRGQGWTQHRPNDDGESNRWRC
ncbi:peptidase inhibitor family I36 protein [Streptomyces sp. PmtG]